MDVFNVMATMTLMDMISAPLRAIRAQMKTTGNTADGLGSRMGKLAKALLPLAAAAGIVLASLISPIRAAGDFEAAMSRVGAVSNATPAEMLKLSRATRELGATTEWSAMQVAEGQKYLAMAGFTVQQNVAALPAVLNMASAGATDLGRAADISSDILSAFNLEASQMPRVADTLTAAFTTSNTSLELLGETMKYVAPVAEKAGLSIESTAAMAGLLGNVGIKGSQAGTALRSMLNGLAAPSSEASKAIAKLGVQTMDAAGNLRSPIAILQDMAKATETMGSAQKMAFTKTVFGTEAMSAVLALFDKAGSGGIAKYAAQLHAAGTAAEIAAKQNDNWRGDIKSLGSAFESLEITIGSLFLPAMRGITTVATGVVRTLDALAGHPVGRFLISLAAVAGTAVLAITVLTLAVWAGTTAWGALSAVLMANPIIIVAMALVALGAGLVALYNECAPVRSAFQYLGNIFSLIGERLGGELGAAFFVFKDVLSEVGDAFGSLWTSISACFAPLADLTGVADGSGWRFFGEVIGVVIGGAFRLLAAGVRVALTPLRMVLSSLTTVIDLFSGKISLAEAGRKLVSTFVAGIKSMAMAPFKAVKGVLSRVRQLLPFSDAKEGPLSSLTRSGRAHDGYVGLWCQGRRTRSGQDRRRCVGGCCHGRQPDHIR